MVTRFEAYKSKAKSLICSALSTSAQFADNFAPVLNPLYVPARLAELGHGLLCNKDPGTYTNPGMKPPFLYGQCAGNYWYEFTATLNYANGSSFVTGPRQHQGYGPFSQVTYRIDPTNPAAIQALYVKQNGSISTGGMAWQPFQGNIVSVTNFTAVYVSGDQSCGSLPGTALPPAPVTYPGQDTNYTDDDGNPVTETRDWTFFPPYIDISDNLSIDIDIGDLNLTANFYPDFNIKPRLPSPKPQDGPIEGDESITPDPEEDLEQEQAQRYIGVRIYAKKLSGANVTEIFQEDVPDLIVPRVANVYFRHDFDSGKNWTSAIECTNLRAYIPVMGVLPASDIKVEFATGFTGYFVKVPEPKKPVP